MLLSTPAATAPCMKVALKHSPSKDISASHSSPFHTPGSGEGDATRAQKQQKKQRSQSCILPVPQPKVVMGPFKEPCKKILPAQHDAVPLMGAESSAPAQTHSGAKNRHFPTHTPPSPGCHLRSWCDGFREGRSIYRSWWGRYEGASQCLSVSQPLGALGPLLVPTACFWPLPGVAPWAGQQRRSSGTELTALSTRWSVTHGNDCSCFNIPLCLHLQSFVTHS